MELVIGTILSTGQTLDQVLDMSWDHIHLTAKSIMAHKTFMLENIFQAISSGLGGKKGKGKTSKRKRPQKRNLSAQEKDDILLSQIRGAGLKV